MCLAPGKNRHSLNNAVRVKSTAKPARKVRVEVLMSKLLPTLGTMEAGNHAGPLCRELQCLCAEYPVCAQELFQISLILRGESLLFFLVSWSLAEPMHGNAVLFWLRPAGRAPVFFSRMRAHTTNGGA